MIFKFICLIKKKNLISGSLSVDVDSSQEDLETTGVQEGVVQRDPRPQVHHPSHTAHSGPH